MFKTNNATSDGFQMTFANGWTVSVQWGPHSYASKGLAEIAAWNGRGHWHTFDDGDTVQGYQTADQVARLMEQVSNFPATTP